MKKAGYIFLALMMLLQAGGLLLFYEAEQIYVNWHNWQSIKEGREDDRKEQITISLNEYNKCKVGKDELLLHGKMYDIRSLKTDGTIVLLEVICDQEEDDILADISRITKQHRKDQNAIPHALMDWLSFVYILPEPYSLQCILYTKQALFTRPFLPIISRIPPIVSPPPREVSCIVI